MSAKFETLKDISYRFDFPEYITSEIICKNPQIFPMRIGKNKKEEFIVKNEDIFDDLRYDKGFLPIGKFCEKQSITRNKLSYYRKKYPEKFFNRGAKLIGVAIKCIDMSIFKRKTDSSAKELNNKTIIKDYKDTDEYKSLSAGKKAAFTRNRIKELSNVTKRVIESPEVKIEFTTVDGAVLKYKGKISNIKVNGKRLYP